MRQSDAKNYDVFTFDTDSFKPQIEESYIAGACAA